MKYLWLFAPLLTNETVWIRINEKTTNPKMLERNKCEQFQIYQCNFQSMDNDDRIVLHNDRKPNSVSNELAASQGNRNKIELIQIHFHLVRIVRLLSVKNE